MYQCCRSFGGVEPGLHLTPESAAENSARSETGTFAEQFTALCSNAPEFREFDVVEVYGD